MTDGRTHYEGCWREHLDCAGKKIAAERERREKLERERDIAVSRLALAFEAFPRARALCAPEDAERHVDDLKRLYERNAKLERVVEAARYLANEPPRSDPRPSRDALRDALAALDASTSPQEGEG